MKRSDSRPNVIRENVVLELVGGFAMLCLLAGCFLLFNLARERGLAVGMFVAGILYDQCARWFFFEQEVYRLRKATRGRREKVVQRVRGRAGYTWTLPERWKLRIKPQAASEVDSERTADFEKAW